MPRTAATPEQRERARNGIRKAAAELYAESGAAGITVRAIAQRAGVSTGTVYSYFGSLAELMQSLWEGPVARADQQMQAVADAHRDPVRRVRALLRAYADFVLRNPDLHRGAILFVRPPGTSPPDVRPPEQLAFYRLLRVALQEGQLAGDFRRGNVDLLAQTLWAGLHGALALPVNLDRFALESSQKLAQEMIPTLLRALEP